MAGVRLLRRAVRFGADVRRLSGLRRHEQTIASRGSVLLQPGVMEAGCDGARDLALARIAAASE